MINFRSTKAGKPYQFLDEYPLSYGQAALWFHYKLAPESAAYNLAGAVAVPGDTDLRALRRAFQEVAERHPMLRTLFASENDEPVQRVTTAMQAAFQVEDASGWNHAQFKKRLAEETYRPFDLEIGPTWRVVILQNAPISGENELGARSGEHLVLLVLHHILADMWSIAILLSEVAALYRQGTTGAPAKLRPLRGSYAGYVDQELERLGSPQSEISLNYWRTVLSGELSPLSLPADRPRRPMSSGRGAAHSILLDQKLTNALRALAEEQHTELYAVLLSAFQALLHRYTGQNDILVGFPKAGRDPSTMRVVGYFVNQMVVRTDFSEDPGFSKLLNSVQNSLEDGAEHDWVPFSLLVQDLKPGRDLSRSPLIQAVFSWQRAPRLIPGENAGPFVLGQKDQKVDLNGMQVRSIDLPYRAAPFDLMMLAAEAPNGLAITIEYAVDLFESSTIARMAECYRTLLVSVVNAPERPVSELEIMPEAERERVVEAWNATTASYPAQAGLHQLFEEQVERTPDFVAAASGEEKVTYRQLNRQANQLAHFLQAQGVGPGSLVGVFLEPSVQMIAAALGILKAGGAYLPLDPSNPRERLAFMLSDARPSWLITRQELRQRLPDAPCPIFLIDSDKDQLHDQPQSNPSSVVTPDHLAYVIFTSGSTGQPKGVALAHRGVVNLLADFQRRHAIQPGDACSWWTSPGFDVSVYEMFSPLLAGGSLYVIPENLRLDVPNLLDWLSIHQIRSAYLPPFFLEDLADWVKDHPGGASLRRLLVGVEPIPEPLLVQINEELPSLAIINGYGPTETTICSTLYQVGNAPSHPGNTPIGRPVANTQIYLLDQALKPVPVGVEGELYIGGVGLARGYLNQPELTAQRFIPSPFRPGERLYRTGDLARYLPDGNLAFVGRSDTQVKLHGVRIELGEIEAVLAQHPQVKQTAVLLQEQTSGRKHLVAYVTGAQDNPLSPGELRQFLEQRLPQSMLPSEYIELDAFPLTTSGKVNRKALPVPQGLPSKKVSAHLTPRSEAERILASIWQQVLGVEAIGKDDNFFELGGDSIMSLQIVARAAQAGIHLTPRDIFRAPTIAGLASLANPVWPMPDQGKADCDSGVIPLTPIQRWFFEQNFPEPQHWNQSLMFITRQSLDPIHLRSAVSALLKQHDALRLRFIKGPSGWQQTCGDPGDEVPFEVVDLSGLSETEQTDAIQIQAAALQNRLDLSAGPLIRVIYFILGDGHPGRLLMVIHHLAVDGVSWRVLLEDLQSAYRQVELGEPLSLPPKTTAFRTWASRLADFARSPETMQEAGYWLRIAEYCPFVLPVDQPISDQPGDSLNKEGSARSLSISLGLADTQALLRNAADAYGTGINGVLLTALIQAFHRWTGNEAIWIDLESHGREDLFEDFDLSRTVGWFTALFPAYFNLSPHARAGKAIHDIQEQLRLIPHHGLDYGLIRYLCPDQAMQEQLKAIPHPPVSFNYLGQLQEAASGSLVSDLAPEPVLHQRSPEARRTHQIEINAAIIQGELHVDWGYNPHLHSRQTIERVAEFFLDELRCLIPPKRHPKSPAYVPLDFPGAGLSQVELDAILKITSRLKEAAYGQGLEAIYPLSPMQKGMLFHTLYTPDSGIYFEQTLLTIRGEFDITAFEKAWQHALKRHAILRTSFVWQGLERVLQIVHKDVEVPFDILDWQDLPLNEVHTRLERVLSSDRLRGFDLSTPPLLRLKIIRTSSDTYRILFSHHHALLDGWSISLLFKEVFTSYQAFITASKPALPPARPYQDYISWLQYRDFDGAEAFWRKELDGIASFKRNPDHFWSLPPHGAAHPAEQSENLSSHITAALQTLARRQHLTLSTVVQGAWAILLSRRSHRDDILFGVTVSGRASELPGITSMLGLFINTLPLRVRITPRMRLIEWLQNIQDKVVEIQKYDYTPLAQIQTWSQGSRISPLFDTLLVFENYPAQAPSHEQLGQIRISNVRSIEQTTYPLTVAVTPGKQLNLRMLYDPGLFEPEDIHRLLGELRDVLEGMIASQNQCLSTLFQGIPFEADRGFGSWVGKTKVYSSQTSLIPTYRQRDKRARDTTAATPGDGNPRRTGPLEEYLIQGWKELLKTDRVGVHDNFFQLGGDSLSGAICIYQLQNLMHETIPLSAIFEAPTIFELASYLEQKNPAGVAQLLGTSVLNSPSVEETIQPPALVPIQPKGRKPPLFCIHPAGGIVFPYYTLAAYLGKDRPLYGLQDPSLYDAKQVPESIESMAAGYILAIQMVQPEGPYYLLGWSAGGEVAYEMAQQLFRQGEQVAKLIMLDTRAPVIARGANLHVSLKDWLSRFTFWMKRSPGRIRGAISAIKPIIVYIHSGLYLLSASSKLGDTSSEGKPAVSELIGWAVLDTWRAYLLGEEAEVASAVSQEKSLLLIKMPAVRRILKLVREHRRLARRYVAERYPGQITLFRANSSNVDQGNALDPTLGWDLLAENGVDVRIIPANHVALLVKPHIEVLAKELKDCLDRAA